MSGMRSAVTGPRDAARLGPLDPREAAWRTDLADIALAGRVAAAAYAEPAPMAVTAERAAVRGEPRRDAAAVSELLFGESFHALDVFGGWAWGWCGHDHYVGYVDLSCLGAAARPNRMVGPGDALLFADASIKAPVAGRLPMGARVEAFEHDDAFCRLIDGRFVHRRHLLPLEGHRGADWLGFAHQFLGAPYQWGGRSRAGVDCSGLVQVALMLAGVACRRDSDMQAASLGRAVEGPRRGALAFWPGHVGVMLDEATLLHANAHWMAVVAEPLADVVARAEKGGNNRAAAPRFRLPL